MTGSPISVVPKQLASWAEQKRFTVSIDRRFKLGETAEAWEYSWAGHAPGKSVIELVSGN